LISVDEYILSVLLISIVAGLIGSLVGIGGGIIIVPVLTVFYGVPIPYAIGASIVSVIATSSGSASAYVKDKITNLRIGMFLEIATTTGAILGAVTTLFLIRSGLEWLVFFVFGSVLILSAFDLQQKARLARSLKGSFANREPNELATRLKLGGEYYDAARGQKVTYVPKRVPAGLGVMFAAGVISGLLGIGSGALKVLAMDTTMRLPFKVSTTTSNFMIGVTAAASTAIFYISGYVNLILVGPVAIGVVAGSFIGTRILLRTRPASLRWLFVAVLLVLGIEMIQRGIILH
jgi:uncharacterized membrane protein YfcA